MAELLTLAAARTPRSLGIRDTPSSDARLVWLASYPKSGNTWLRAFLHNLLRNPQEGYDINKLGDFTFGESAYGWYRRFDERPLEAYTDAEVAALAY